MELNEIWLKRIVTLALEEDVGLGDVTTLSTVPVGYRGKARMWLKEDAIVAGMDVGKAVFAHLDSSLQFIPSVKDGEFLTAGTEIARVEGKMRSILTGERTALNFMQRLSGIATQTGKMVKLLEGTRARVIDTRKTTPGLRMLEKYAVSVGGGANHRWALDSGVLIKDNHLRAAGGVEVAVRTAREKVPHSLAIQVECKELSQVSEAVRAGADVVMLDNMRGDVLRAALEIVAGKCRVEVSGGVTASVIRELALPGVDLISVGALTHSAASVDIALDVFEGGEE